MEVDKPFAVQFVHDMHFRHHFLSRLLSYLQELSGIFRPRAFLFNFLHNAKFTPREDNKGYAPGFPLKDDKSQIVFGMTKWLFTPRGR